MKAKHWLLLGALGALTAQVVACSSDFHSCQETRTCPRGGGAGTGDAGSEESGGSSGGEVAGRAGGAGRAGAPETDGGEGGIGGSSGSEAGAAGELEGPCDGANLKTDPKHCGTCENDCTASPNLATDAGITCQAGKCLIPDSACVSGKKHCSTNAEDVCEADVTTSAQCGACGTKCDTAQVCSGGSCVDNCPGGATKCTAGQSVGCYALATTADHCGACDKVCPAPPSNGTAVCQSNACKVQCGNGYHQCNSSAQCEANDDVANCGPTCKQCETNDPNATPTCSNNTCSYPCKTGFQFCGFCTSKSDPSNCGACGNVCGSGKSCINGACLAADGVACLANGDCQGGKCTTFYADQDGDGHGLASSGTKQLCGSAVPAGYSALNDDCCDVGADAGKIFPGQTKFFTASTTSCGKAWDYDCDGQYVREINLIYSVNCKTANNKCLVQEATAMWAPPTTSIPGCGSAADVTVCLGLNLETPNGYICGSTTASTQVQGCH